MRSSLVPLLGLSALTLALGACSVNPESAICNPVQLKTVSVPQLIYPVPSYAQVPDNATFIVVAYPDAPSLAQTISITPKGGAALSLGPFGAAPQQIPKPHANPLPGQGAEYGISLPKLTAHTTYSVMYRFANTANLCGESTVTKSYMGEFTTV